jgi:predicted glutamine amidotransferase
MCRLFGMVAASARDAFDHLATKEFSLLAQSDFDPKRLQKDGWGLGSWHGRAWTVVRSSGAVFKETKTFERASRGAVSRIVLAHLREASNPRGLSHKKLISLDNTQPFQSGRYLFMHNGVLTIPVEVAARLGPYKKNLKGTNDSEVLFWSVLRNIRKIGNVPKAFSRSVEELWSIWEKCDQTTRSRASKLYGSKAPYFGLNCLISDGKTLWAFCKHDKACNQKDLCGRGRPVFEICHTTRGDATYVASERTDRAKDWEFMPEGTVLTVRAAKPKDWHLSDI